MTRWIAGAALAISLIVPPAVLAQQEALSRAFELERRGEYAAAVEAYRSVLSSRPGDPAALLGLERALLPINRSAEILPDARAAMAANPASAPIYGVAMRAWAAAEEPDSLRAVAERWAAAFPGDETPYREWGAAALAQRDRPGAEQAYLRGRQALHRPDALAPELAQLAIANGDFPAALREWLPAVRRLPGYRTSAVTSLARAPDSVRNDLLHQLAREQDFTARRMEAELRARWGDPTGAVESLLPALPADRSVAVESLRGLLDPLRTQATPAGAAAQGRVLEALAERSPDAERARLRLDAARVYTAAGDRDAARRMLTGIADDRAAPGAVAVGASSTLVQVLIGEGRLDEAERRLTESRASMPAGDYAALRRRLVEGYLRAGNLERADSALRGDSTIDGLALSGRIRLYRGDVPGAIEQLRAAGPFAGDRPEATERTALLALLQPIERDSSPALGQALLALAQGDTARAIAGLGRVAGELSPAKGGAELLLLAGRLAVATGKAADAEHLLRAAATPDAPGTAPAAELALAELFLRQRRPEAAVAQLEHLILTYPASALVPQARRRLDEARGGVPQT